MKLLDDEKFLNKEVYNALCDMGVKDKSAQTLAAEAARYDRRLDSLERSMLAMQTGFRHEMREAISMSDKNTTKAIHDLQNEMKEDNRKFREEMKTTTVKMKTDMEWLKRISLVILGVLAALLIQSFF